MPAPKKPAAVIAAEAERDKIAAELSAARESVTRLEGLHSAALAEVRAARLEADAALPQCSAGSVGRAADTRGGAMVILRKTPTGMLVVRPAGMPDVEPSRYEWNKYQGRYEKWGKRSMWSGTPVLLDVPAEFMPATAAA